MEIQIKTSPHFEETVWKFQMKLTELNEDLNLFFLSCWPISRARVPAPVCWYGYAYFRRTARTLQKRAGTRTETGFYDVSPI